MKYRLQKLFEEYSITGLNFNSKKIKPGNAFFAIKGSNFDGNAYIQGALRTGAKLAFTDDNQYKNQADSKIIYVEDIRRALSEAASIFYSKIPANLIAVTGTNGKTSVVSYCQQLFELLGKKSASVGTIGVKCSNKNVENHFKSEQYQSLTTADILTFREILYYLAENDIDYTAFEASSHGIEQGRISGVNAAAAAFTSFSLDHLDYHKTMGNYLDAKLKLFTSNLAAGALSIINSEIAEINYIEQFLSDNNVDYLTVGAKGQLSVEIFEQSIFGQKIVFDYLEKNYVFHTSIIGSFQANNLTIAAMLVHKFGFSLLDIVERIPEIKAVPGRLERATNLDDNYQIFIDYAHTPDALDKSLRELKKVKKASGRLMVLLGCGGDRDSSKRPLMGNIASKIADVVIITDDNPRFENPADIRKEILLNCPKATEIGDRQEAIFSAINMLNDNDILLIAGKGHEDYQIINDKKIPFDDMKITKEILRKKK